MRVVRVMAMLMLGISGVASAQSQLSVAGQPYFGGNMVLSLTAPLSIGKPILLAVGLNPLPLDSPLPSSKGPFYVGNLVTVLGLGAVPATGIFNLAFVMPDRDPGLAGIRIATQAYVDGKLSNPAAIPLDMPYFTAQGAVAAESPEPQTQALFGDQVAVGDLNADGTPDIVVGAWFQDVTGVDKSGSVFVLWGPGFGSSSKLEPPAPKLDGNFGNGLILADLDSDGALDLVVGESTGSQALPGVFGQLHVYWGGTTFSTQPGATIFSTSTGVELSGFGRRISHGDFNADGWIDICVGNEQSTVAGVAQAGKATVYWGPGFGSWLDITSPTIGDHDYFGSSLAAGDVTGDGIHDLVEGSGRDDVGGTINMGSVHVFAGPDLHLLATIDCPFNYGFNTRFGEAVALSDIDGDGVLDVAVSDERNHVYLFEAPSFALRSTVSKPPVDGLPPSTQTGFGWRSLVAGDVNGDGNIDVLVPDGEGTAQGCGLLGKEGRVYCALSPYFSTFLTLDEPMSACGDGFSTWIVMTSLDSDNRPEAVVGAPTRDVPLQNAGSIWVFDSN